LVSLHFTSRKANPRGGGPFFYPYSRVCFSFFQGLEYRNARFDISDGVFGSTFYLLTGFHGVHVLVGWIFLATAFVRLCSGHLSSLRHLGYEMAIWYWHFVDVIWVFLFFAVYVYGTHQSSMSYPPVNVLAS